MHIRVLAAVGLAKIRKVAPTPRLVKGKVVLDNDTLQAVLRNRCEVMTSYAKAAERVYRQELEQEACIGRREKFLRLRAVRNRFRQERAGRGDVCLSPSFFIIGVMWANHHSLFEYIRQRASG